MVSIQRAPTHRLLWWNAWVLLVYVTTQSVALECDELLKFMGYPCSCTSLPDAEFAINCDHVVLPNDFPSLPFQAQIISFRHRSAGTQSLPTLSFVQSGLPIRHLDFSDNSIRRLSERVFSGLSETLQELRLAKNLLGDSLNPIFSTSEFHGLGNLKILDLSWNHIKALEEGLLKGCSNLQEIYLDYNSFIEIPSGSLNGPQSLKILSIESNRIGSLRKHAFSSQSKLERLALGGNRISSIEEGTFSGLSNLMELKLSQNRLNKLNSGVFAGAESVQILDLSGNFLAEFPAITLQRFSSLKRLNLSSNLIEKLDSSLLASVPHLELLDISRNRIVNVAPGTFLSLRHMRYLDLSVNTLRTIEDDAFEGLNNLDTLSLQDNNILLVPASALGRLPRLTKLQLDFNRVAALGSDILRAVADRVMVLSFARNVVRELPPDAFQDFRKLKSLDLSGNLLLSIEMASFSGLEETLEELYLRGNRLSSLPAKPLMLLKMRTLDLSYNHLTEIPRTSFLMVSNLLSLNLSHNQQLSAVPSTLFHPLTQLRVLDMSHCALKLLSPELLMKSGSLNNLSLRHNFIEELTESAFQNLKNLTTLDLSENGISNIRPGCFAHIHSLKRLDLKGNKLASFKGEFFITRRSNGTQLEYLDLSNNALSYLFPSSFRVHPKLKTLIATQNRFSFFPAELIVGLNYIQHIDIGGNMLKSLEEFDFGRLPRLRVLLLNNNFLDSISETAFHNSTQLQIIDLSGNRLERLGERTFQGLGRIQHLYLNNNLLSELPESIFERTKLRMLENVDLSDNLFEVAPLKTLQKQYFFLNSVRLARNKLREIPPDDSIMVNIKVLDLSFNNLSSEAIGNVLGEPKTARELNLAGTGITRLVRLETPFLQNLNLSYNQISDIPENVFERPTLLGVLDLSHNKISSISNTMSRVWSKLKNLEAVDLSSNPIETIVQDDFAGLQSLKKLNISDLEDCTKIEKAAFKNLTNLAELEAYNFPRLGYLDVTGLLHSLPSLEHLDVEVKDSVIGGEQLSAAMNPRLRNLGIRGPRVKSISSSSLAGLKSPKITINIKGTSLEALLPAILIPLPRSSKVILNVEDNQISTLSPQFLSALDDRRGDLMLSGLETNPITCDCNSRALRRSEFGAKIICSRPDYLAGKKLIEVGDDDLTCDPHRPTSTTEPPSTIRTTRRTESNMEPDIIWTIESSSTTHRAPNKPFIGSTSINNDDTLIISIVGGVVAFIAVLIIIICVVKLRWTDPADGPYLPPGSLPPHFMQHCNNPACPCPKLPPMLPPHPPSSPPYGMTYATLPGKRFPSSVSPPLRPTYSTLGRSQYPPPSSHPFYMSYASGEDKENGSR